MFLLEVFLCVFKWVRLIFFLISLEFLMLSLFCDYSFILGEVGFFYFMVFSVVSSVLGMVLMVSNVKFFGSDYSVF
uniref:NADH dehydrogenase subunit 4L n=1 Tax=Gnathostoma binucleatum TaxID=61466 RepID=UPI00257BAE40|nr:NADH dehydrogenase subunit 4L [Gnathostoma binucleatum]WHE41121.1 NADH dehydrogenase subunit 4L [Gnathostoma binucleatum]